MGTITGAPRKLPVAEDTPGDNAAWLYDTEFFQAKAVLRAIRMAAFPAERAVRGPIHS